MTSPSDRQRVAVVTGGGSGIGAAIAEELGRAGTFVVTIDPLVTVEGLAQEPDPSESTAGRIVAAGGSARASAVSVTDRKGVEALFADLVAELGGVDAVVNVAGITRQMGYTDGSEDDWRSVLAVHLDGFLNILGAALPIMAAQGHGHVLGVTSGSGWRAADTGAYGCAKRAVASLTWELGRQLPPGVVINAISPIAMTRMVVAAMERHRATAPPAAASKGGGLVLGTKMPTAEQLGPVGAHLVGEAFAGCRGQVIFHAGSELAVVDQPRLLEVLGTDGVDSVAHALEAFTAGALVPAEGAQATKGGSNPRFGASLSEAGDELPATAVRSCLVVSDRAELATQLATVLAGRGVASRSAAMPEAAFGFDGAAAALADAVEDGAVDAIVLALASITSTSNSGDGVDEWARSLAEHAGITDGISADAAWARAVAEHAIQTGVPVRFVTVTDAATAGGRSRGQAVAQHARSARGSTGDLVSGFSLSDEGGAAPLVAEVVAHLLCSPDAPELSGAELVAGHGFVGLRSHPRVGASITYAGGPVPAWLDATLEEITR